MTRRNDYPNGELPLWPLRPVPVEASNLRLAGEIVLTLVVVFLWGLLIVGTPFAVAWWVFA